MIRYIFTFFLAISAIVFSCNNRGTESLPLVTKDTSYEILKLQLDAIVRCCAENIARADSLQALLDKCRKRPTTIQHVDNLYQQ